MRQRNARRTDATTADLRRDRRADALTLGLVIAVVSLALGVVTAKAQDASLQDAMNRGWSGYEQQPLRVNVWHDREDGETYGKGESVRLHFETNHDAYAVVYRIDAEGEVDVLWPRSRLDDGFVFAHHTYNLPAPGSRRIRTSGEEGIEYVQVIVSAYPFDLRGLDIDFHHEVEDEPRNYYVAGDPFLAMNDVNFEVTGLEDPEDFVVTNYTSWYVGRPVDHPRYLCSQCHDDDMDWHPYDDSCTITIRHDYGWGNEWYPTYGYYPAYHYPVYYYVDPWSYRPWINYWYRPWYTWPRYTFAWSWGWDPYCWSYSPYWSGDVWVRYKSGSRRHRPLSKGTRYREVADNSDYRHPRSLVKNPRPTSDVRETMERREKLVKTDGRRPEGGKPTRESYANVAPAKRKPTTFTKPARTESRTGIRVPTRYPNTTSGEAVRRGTDKPARPSSSSPGVQVRPDPRRGGERDTPRVQPVEPRSRGSRIWNGGSTGTRAVKPKPGTSSQQPSRTPTVKPRSMKGSDRPAVKPSTNRSSGSSNRSKGTTSSSSKGSSVRKSGGSKSSPARSNSSGSSRSSGSRSSGSSKSGGKSGSKKR